MRKLGILAVILAMTVLGCDKDDMSCKCDLNVVVFDASGGNYTITGVDSDCEGNYDLGSYVLPHNHVIVGQPFNCR